MSLCLHNHSNKNAANWKRIKACKFCWKNTATFQLCLIWSKSCWQHFEFPFGSWGVCHKTIFTGIIKTIPELVQQTRERVVKWEIKCFNRCTMFLNTNVSVFAPIGRGKCRKLKMRKNLGCFFQQEKKTIMETFFHFVKNGFLIWSKNCWLRFEFLHCSSTFLACTIKLFWCCNKLECLSASGTKTPKQG